MNKVLYSCNLTHTNQTKTRVCYLICGTLWYVVIRVQGILPSPLHVVMGVHLVGTIVWVAILFGTYSQVTFNTDMKVLHWYSNYICNVYMKICVFSYVCARWKRGSLELVFWLVNDSRLPCCIIVNKSQMVHISIILLTHNQVYLFSN